MLGTVLLVLAGALFIARLWLAAAVAARIEHATGHRTTVGSVSLSGRTVIARDVVVFGAPPFESEPLARVRRLDARLGGAGGLLSPAEVSLDGVEVEYLGTGAVDNVGRRARRNANVAPGPTLRVRHGTMRGTIHPSRGPRVGLRVRNFSLDIGPEGDRSIALEGLVAEVAGWLTATLPELIVNSDPQGGINLHGESASLLVPGGGPLIEELTVEGRWSQRAVELALTREPGVGRPKASPHVKASFRADGESARLSLDASDLTLKPLHPWFDRVGLLLDRTRADLHLVASVDVTKSEIPFEMEVRARGLDVRNPSIDTRVWRNLPIELHAAGDFEPVARRTHIRAAELEGLGLRLMLDGWTDLGAVPRGSWKIHTAGPIPCGRILPAAPEPVRDALGGMRLAGDLGLSVAVAFDAAAWDTLSLEVGVDPVCQVSSEPAALAALLATLTKGTPPQSKNTSLPLGPYHSSFAPLTKMPAHLPGAFLTAEDGRFFSHDGFDKEMIRRALAHDLEMRSFAKGGSTITQQLAKNLFLVQSRTLARKLEETVLTWRLGQLVDKKRLLELYLNVVELGPDIRGVKQAARVYFGKELAALKPLESAHLAALAPNPSGLSRRFRDGRVDEGWLQRLYDLLGMMNRSGRLSRSDLATARAATLTLRKI